MSAQPDGTAATVGGHGDAATWQTRLRRTARIRRASSLAVFVVGLITVLSGVTPTIGRRFRVLQGTVPFSVHQAAYVTTALAGAGTMVLAGGIRRGRARAWLACLILLTWAALSHLVKGLDVEEAVLCAVAAVWLASQSRHFQARDRGVEPQRGAWWLLGGSVAVVLVGAATALVVGRDHRHHPIGWRRALAAVGERFVGRRDTPIGGRFDRALTPTLGALGVVTMLLVTWLIARRERVVTGRETRLARQIVAAHGSDSLAYFALRHDKQLWIEHDTVVAYGLFGNVCLVSPDPVGPPESERQAWNSFVQFATDHGWTLAVLAASERWESIYRGFGMSSMYIGDEAIVDVERFSLQGGDMKGLRQATNRIARSYSIEFCDPATLDPQLAEALRRLLVESRRGGVERGFSMTLSRVFEPDDAGLLLAVCFDVAQQPVAFCQFVPAGADTYSLDLMRRSTGDHPNGLTDFVLVRTIEHLRGTPRRYVSLNFATMRGVLAGERNAGLLGTVQRNVLGRLSGSMQIESLWRYNDKFRPSWRPRFLVYDAAEHLAAIGLAVARAESFWELPVIGGLVASPKGSAGAQVGGTPC